MDELEIRQVDAPIGLIPDLSLYGIEEIDSGVCENTYENRKALRANHLRWSELYNADGTLSGNLQVITPEMIDARGQSKRPILDQPTNINSDYITGYDLLMEPEAEKLVPTWVMAATRHWTKVEEKREQTGQKFRPALATAPGRCTAHRVDGSRCWNWHNGTVADGEMCRMHLGRHGNGADLNYVEKARNRVRSAALAAVDTLEELLENAASEPVRLKAAETLLDRAGVRAGVEIDQTVTHEIHDAGDLIAQRLKRLAPKAEEIEEAEVIEDKDDDDT